MNSKPCSVLIVDDHAFIREGLRSFLADTPGFRVIGEAASGEEALKLAQQLQPDFILLDINLPGMNGLELVGPIRKSIPAAKILILTVHNSREYVLHVARSGAHGYILKEAPPEELLQAMKVILGGKRFYSPSVASYIVDEYDPKSAGKKADRQLTPREVEVLILTAKGKSIKEMADELAITAATVQTYRVRIMEKLEIHHVAGLVKYALQKGYLPLE